MSRKKKPKEARNGWTVETRGDPRTLWWMAAFAGLALALVCSVPMVGRFVLLAHADGFARTTLTVQAVSSTGRKGADRYQAEGPLGTGGTGRVRLTQFAPMSLATLEAVEAHFGARPVVLDVMVNPALGADEWYGSFRVRRSEPDLRGVETRNALKLSALIAAGLALAVFAATRALRPKR